MKDIPSNALLWSAFASVMKFMGASTPCAAFLRRFGGGIKSLKSMIT
jgi:hypothetical protein